MKPKPNSVAVYRSREVAKRERDTERRQARARKTVETGRVYR